VAGRDVRAVNTKSGISIIVDEAADLSLDFSNWRFNLCGSDTESLLRLNMEIRGSRGLFNEKLEEIETVIKAGC